MINGYSFDSNTMINGKTDFDDNQQSAVILAKLDGFTNVLFTCSFCSDLFCSLNLFVQFCSLVHSSRFFNYAGGNEEKWNGREGI